MSMVNLRKVGWRSVNWRKVDWKNSDVTTDTILFYDADIDGTSEQVGAGHTFNSSILSPQYHRNADGSYTDVGAGPAVDTFDGEKWLRSCGAVTNLFGGDTSTARSVSLTAQAYTLQVFGAGSVSCSYGTATVVTPLTFTATAGLVTFTPIGATLWMLTATPYPAPYTPPGTTMPASNATVTNGCWFTLPDGSPVWKALTGEPLTLATRVRMGVGSGDLVGESTNRNILSWRGDASDYALRGFEEENNISIIRVYDSGGASISRMSSVWARNSVVRTALQVNTTGTQFRVGYMIEGTHTTIQWSSWVAYDGSFDPSTLYRLMLCYNNPYPMWFNKIAVWKEEVSDARILEALS